MKFGAEAIRNEEADETDAYKNNRQASEKEILFYLLFQIRIRGRPLVLPLPFQFWQLQIMAISNF
jgi:hypothetical protein